MGIGDRRTASAIVYENQFYAFLLPRQLGMNSFVATAGKRTTRALAKLYAAIRQQPPDCTAKDLTFLSGRELQ